MLVEPNVFISCYERVTNILTNVRQTSYFYTYTNVCQTFKANNERVENVYKRFPSVS